MTEKYLQNNSHGRIGGVFRNLKSKDQKAFIPFITAGFPDLDRYIELYFALDKSGADIIEVGIPFSDPIADGPVLQTTSNIALKRGINTDNIFKSIQAIRKHSLIPVVILAYFNTVLRYGIDDFLRTANEVGVDGTIIPDLPVEELHKYKNNFYKYHIDPILLVSLTSGPERIREIIANCRGFLYCLSVKGVTGEQKNIDPELIKLLSYLRNLTEIPLCPGFGISNLDQIKELKNHCDGLIIGSKLSSIILESRNFKEGLKKLKDFTIGVNHKLKNS